MMTAGRQATLRDVAALAEVSPKTVSNVIAGRIYVRPDTRDRVQRAIDELRYRPNAMARYLRLGTVHAIGLVLPDLLDARYSRFADAVVTSATARGLVVIIHTTRGFDPVEAGTSMPVSHDLARGFILCSDSLSPSALERTWKPRPRIIVSFGGSAEIIEVGEVGTTRTRSHVMPADPTFAGKQAVDLLSGLLTPQELRT